MHKILRLAEKHLRLPGTKSKSRIEPDRETGLFTYFDYIFLFGDLNYRLSGKKTEIEDLIKKKGEQDLFSTTPKRTVIQIVI